MTELKQIAAILYRILSKPVTVRLWVVCLLGFACMSGIGWLHGWIGFAMLALICAAVVGLVMVSEDGEE
jgi:hypothetical protein